LVIAFEIAAILKIWVPGVSGGPMGIIRARRPGGGCSPEGGRRGRQSASPLMEWSGRAPYLTGEWRWEGTLKEHCHVRPIQCDRCHNGHRYRQEFVVDRAEERAGPEFVGDQALMRGLVTAFPFVRPGLSLPGVGRRSCDRSRRQLGSSPCRSPALATARLCLAGCRSRGLKRRGCEPASLHDSSGRQSQITSVNLKPHAPPARSVQRAPMRGRLT
jgi:hypothetical protein